jgi:hypothetical protein
VTSGGEWDRRRPPKNLACRKWARPGRRWGGLHLQVPAGADARLVGRWDSPRRQSVGAKDDAAIYGASGAVGTIGSDVLARFGAVRIDYKAETLTVEGGEGEPIDGLAEAAGARCR